MTFSSTLAAQTLSSSAKAMKRSGGEREDRQSGASKRKGEREGRGKRKDSQNIYSSEETHIKLQSKFGDIFSQAQIEQTPFERRRDAL